MDVKKTDSNILKVIFFTSIFVALIIIAEIEVIRSKINKGASTPAENTQLELVLDPNAGTPPRGWKTYKMPEPMDEDFTTSEKNDFVNVVQYYYKLDYPKAWKFVDYGTGSVRLYQERPKPPDEATDATMIVSAINFGSFPKLTEEENEKDATVIKTELKGYKGELRQSLKFKRYYLYLPNELSGRYFTVSLENPNPDANEVFDQVINSLTIYKKTVKVHKTNSSPVSI